MDLNVRKLILFKGERCKKTLNGGSIRWLKMGFLETLGQHKTLFLPFLRSGSESIEKSRTQLSSTLPSFTVKSPLQQVAQYRLFVHCQIEGNGVTYN